MFRLALIILGLLVISHVPATAQSVPLASVAPIVLPPACNASTGAGCTVWTPAQWVTAWQSKQDWPSGAGGTVATNLALRTVAASTTNTFLRRSGFYAAGDPGGASYVWSNSPCSLNSGGGDNGSQVAPMAGTGCWLASLPQQFNAQIFGVVGDGATNDSAALLAAFAAASALNGYTVLMPPTGHAYLLNAGLTVPNNVSIHGIGSAYWPFNYDTNLESDWTAKGTWIHCTDTVNSCLTFGQGSTVDGLNFWYTQPTPPGSNCGATCTFTHDWTPTTYPYTITLTGNQAFNHFSNINIINATHCIDMEGPSNGVGSFYTHFDHMQLGCFNQGMKFNRVDNQISVSDVNFLVLWYQAFNDVWGYMEGDTTVQGHKNDMRMTYISDASFHGLQFYQSYLAISAANASVGSGLGTVTFAGQGLQFTNTDFNQVCQAIAFDDNTAIFNADFTNTTINVDPQTSVISGQCGQATPIAFNLASDAVDVSFTNINGFEAQNLITVGGGTSGGAHFSGRVRISYSAFLAGANAIHVNAGGFMDMTSGVNNLFPVSGAGTQCTGTCRNWPTVPLGDVWIAGAAGVNRQLLFLSTNTTGGSASRWGLFEDNTTEAGSNSGSNFGIEAYTDTGSPIGSPLQITRASGQVILPFGLSVNGGLFAAPVYTVSVLTTNAPCNSGRVNAQAVVTDATSLTAGSTIAGGGANHFAAICNGTNWIHP